jgi:hypothetical protein
MLKLQEYLRSGNSLDDLANDFGIKITKHPNEPIAIFNYDHLKSKPKDHPIVRECRATCLNVNDYSLVYRGMYRFFNWGELPEEAKSFDWSDFVVTSKEDGSYCVLSYFNNRWNAHTRGSFGDGVISDNYNLTWKDGFCKAMNIADLSDLNLDEKITYIMEFVSPYNKIIRSYDTAEMYLITAFNGYRELSWNELETISSPYFKKVNKYNLSSVNDIICYIKNYSGIDPTFEGVVIRDKNNSRWKLKSDSYLSLSKLVGNNGERLTMGNLVPLVFQGDGWRTLSKSIPEIIPKCEKIEKFLQESINSLIKVWENNKDIVSQKDFALAIKDNPFSSILFAARKLKKHPEDVWRESENLIIKIVDKYLNW